jgi:nitrogen-specific signal transduction histidine kinase
MKENRYKLSSMNSRRSAETIATLARGMSDNFNNILTTVMGACSLIDMDDPANSELREYITLIRTSAERAAVLSDMLMHVDLIEDRNTPKDYGPGRL